MANVSSSNSHKGNAPLLRFPQFNDNKVKKKIKDFANCYAGATPSTQKKEYWENGTIPWLSSGEVNKKRIYQTDTFITQLGFNSCSTKIVPPHTTVMALAGQGKTRGTVAITEIELCTNQSLAAIVTNSSVDDDCLRFYLENQYQNLREISSGDGTRGGLNLTLINEYNVSLPSINEQKKIAIFLTYLEQRINKQRQLVELLKSYKRGLENIVFSPKYSTVISVSDMLTECIERSTINNQYPIISSTKQGLFMQSEYFNKQAASVNTVGYKILRIGQIVFSPQNLWMGNINYNNKFEVGIVSPSYKIYKVNSNYDSLYVGYLLKSNHAIKEYILASEQGASIVRRNLDMQLFGEIKFSVPDITRQRKFSHLLNEVDLLIQKYSSELMLLEKTKIYLLQQLFI